MKVRVISSVILLPVVVTAIIAGQWFFILLVLIATSVAAIEYTQMLRRKGYHLALPLIIAMILLGLAEAVWNQQWLMPGIAVLTLLISAWVLYCREKVPSMDAPTAHWALTLAGGLYLGIGGAYLLKLRFLDDGLWWTLTALPVIWIADSGAYFIGRRWGIHKMAPTISPNKSWEGYVGELVSGSVSGWLAGMLWPAWVGHPIAGLNATTGLLLGVLLALLTPLGDFFVSMIKREAGVKDTGNLIPGHGGVFDRMDSLLWAGIVTWMFVKILQI
ncbi:MAG: phosphatidate cytidylyltransferase [Anaerolineae bacterium]|nr:phosphatidate cytidylyltransferase [Anaerolineae bacterium]